MKRRALLQWGVACGATLVAPRAWSLGEPLPPAATGASAPGRMVSLVPLGEVRPEHLKAVEEAIALRVHAEVRIERGRPMPTEAFYPPRKRYRAEKILDSLDADPPTGAWKVLGVTEAEISTTKGEIVDWGIVGLGNIGGRSAVVSSHIVRKHSKKLEDRLRRLTDFAVHELGHTLGLDHCPVAGCVMRDAQGKAIKSADTSTGEFCDYCRARTRHGILRPRPSTQTSTIRAR